MLVTARQFIHRLAALPLLLCYCMQLAVGGYGLPPAVSVPAADICCDICGHGSVCCCLEAVGGMTCDLSAMAGMVLRPAPCSGMGTLFLVTSAPASIDQMLPAAIGLPGPICQSLHYTPGSVPAHALRLGPPDKVPIV